MSIAAHQLQLKNSLTNKKEPFIPEDSQHIKCYVCGPTVYNYAHIGNARPAIIFDVLFRLLQHLYPRVTYVRNITDVDDKINQAAIDSNQSIQELSSYFTEAYRADISELNVLPPTIEPFATHHINEMIAMITNLINKGVAYVSHGHVLFHVPSDPNYGCLSNRKTEDMLAGARVEIAPYKKDPKDFVLWKPSESPSLPAWESPWGKGRPGWHIECSAMIHAHLGLPIDIHGGGQDLIFPHHENELAQSRCAHPEKKFVNYWLHNGMLTFDGGKMSKSLGNTLTIREALKSTPGPIIRYCLLSSHYQSTLDWNQKLITQAESSLQKFHKALLAYEINPLIQNAEQKPQALKSDLPETLINALCDNLNTPKAITILHEITNQLLSPTKPTSELKKLAQQLFASISILGLSGSIEKKSPDLTLDPSTIEDLIEQRNKARAEKQWEIADDIRKKLLAHNITLEDSSRGTTWKRT